VPATAATTPPRYYWIVSGIALAWMLVGWLSDGRTPAAAVT
jgi:hypothetical protein